MKITSLPIQPTDGPGISSREIDEFVNVLGICIPESYRDFLVNQNGGLLDDAYVDSDTDIGRLIPMSWLGTGEHGIMEQFDYYGDILGKNLLPFCTDPGGNLFCIKVTGCEEEGIYFIDIGSGWEIDGEVKYPQIKIASNLDDFANLVKVSI